MFVFFDCCSTVDEFFNSSVCCRSLINTELLFVGSESRGQYSSTMLRQTFEIDVNLRVERSNSTPIELFTESTSNYLRKTCDDYRRSVKSTQKQYRSIIEQISSEFERVFGANKSTIVPIEQIHPTFLFDSSSRRCPTADEQFVFARFSDSARRVTAQ